MGGFSNDYGEARCREIQQRGICANGTEGERRGERVASRQLPPFSEQYLKSYRVARYVWQATLMYVWDPRARRLPSIRRFILLSSQPPSRGGYRNPPPQPVLPPAPEPVPPWTIHMYVRLWVSKGGFCTMKWETWEANQQIYSSRRSLPSPPLRFHSFLADRTDPHPAIVEELLRPNTLLFSRNRH